MVAPNGARLTQQNHPTIPITTQEIVNTVAESVEQGAQAVHLHVRDSSQRHVLDAVRYREAINAVRQSQGTAFPIQITTEAVGRYTQAEQIAVVKAVKPEFVSVALVEMAGEESQLTAATEFYHWCFAERIGVQHILYSAQDFRRFLALKQRGVIPAEHQAVLFVLGRYVANQLSETTMLDPFLAVQTDLGGELGSELEGQAGLFWMVCAFGVSETECLAYAASRGGHVRVGFENNTLHEDGEIARNNADRVQAVCKKINQLAGVSTSNDVVRQVLGQV